MEKLTHNEVVMLLLQLATMLVLARVFAEIARKFNQPAVVGEILAGILIGPTILGTFFPEGFEFLFRSYPMSNIALAGYSQVAVVLLLLMNDWLNNL